MANKIPVSSFGFKVMEKLYSGRGGCLFKDGRCGIGSLVVPTSLVRDLLDKDLIKITERNGVFLSEPGLMLLRRLRHLQKKNRYPETKTWPEPFSAQHSNFKIEQKKVGKKTETIVRNLGNTPLSWLLRRKDRFGNAFLTMDQFEAGEKLSQDFEYSGLLPKTTGFYDGVPISGKTKGGWRGTCPTERQLAAKERVNKAIAHVGPGLSDILIRVCCFHEGLEQAERHLVWPTRSGKLVLKMALERLVKHYNPKK